MGHRGRSGLTYPGGGQGLAPPAANAATQVPTDLSTFVVAQTTAQIRIGGNRQIAVDH